jgi:NADH dehydrogenase
VKVFVTGATGFVGQEILRSLSEAGHCIRFLAHHPERPSVRRLQEQFAAEVSRGDVLDLDSLKGVLNGIEAVIHVVGIISQAGKHSFDNVHLGGTRNMLLAAGQAGVRRFVHMSALGTRPKAASLYHQTKWASEESVRQSGIAFTIFRPSLIFDPTIIL